jgi:hypothetical protein
MCKKIAFEFMVQHPYMSESLPKYFIETVASLYSPKT